MLLDSSEYENYGKTISEPDLPLVILDVAMLFYEGDFHFNSLFTSLQTATKSTRLEIIEKITNEFQAVHPLKQRLFKDLSTLDTLGYINLFVHIDNNDDAIIKELIKIMCETYNEAQVKIMTRLQNLSSDLLKFAAFSRIIDSQELFLLCHPPSGHIPTLYEHSVIKALHTLKDAGIETRVIKAFKPRSHPTYADTKQFISLNL